MRVLREIARFAIALSIVIGARNADAAYGQNPSRPTFEVVSVKPVTGNLSMTQLDGSRYTSTSTPLSLIVAAYGLTACNEKLAFRIDDCPLISEPVPAWIKTDRFEIQAKIPAGVAVSESLTNTQLRQTVGLMLQGLLEDRFHLKGHRETRDLQIWAITVGKNGPKLRSAGPLRMIKAPDGSEVPVHGRNSFTPVPNVPGRRQITFKASTLQQAVDSLAVFADRPIVDRTGLKGEYDFEIEYDVDQLATPAGPFSPFSGMTCPTLSTALQDVGLKCELTKAPVDILVIDHIEKPSEN